MFILIQEITEKVPLLSSQELLSLMEVIITSLKEKQNSEQQVFCNKITSKVSLSDVLMVILI
ncbi:MAG: hypothetical protein HC916_16705 [Coleofasciculaceae cyanobacterium SM2_1_6]|nr:hypothetical protein [Coleofasciculaceae cyanobacterium SM2_1_6]